MFVLLITKQQNMRRLAWRVDACYNVAVTYQNGESHRLHDMLQLRVRKFDGLVIAGISLSTTLPMVQQRTCSC